MENIMNEEIMEDTVEVIGTDWKLFKTGVVVVAAGVVGVAAYKFVVKPTVAELKRRKDAKKKCGTNESTKQEEEVKIRIVNQEKQEK